LFLSGCETVAGSGESAEVTPEAVAAFESTVTPFLSEYCVKCHNADRMRGDVDLESFASTEVALEQGELWGRVVEMVRSGQMPPKKQTQPTADEITTLVDFLDEQQRARLATVEPHAGRVTVRRLNRAEYNNTVRDLLGVDFRPADDFPPDDSGYGFDTIGSVLSLSPLLMEKYLTAAERIARDAVAREVAEPEDAAAKRYIFSCTHEGKEHSDACARRILAPLARQAYRRPPTRGEINRLIGFVQLARENDDNFEQGIELALQAMLVSPQFLFRVEANERGRFGNPDRRVDSYALASRLSYFLWSSMPDDALLDAAQSGRLRNPGVLRGEIDRMLRDPKSIALAEHFAGQWLQFRNMTTADPDPELFPSFNDALRAAMAEETKLFFHSVVQEDRSILDFIDADYTFVNEALAKHYGIDGISGDAFQRVTVDRAQRGGVLTQASVLTVTSYPTRTSPVLRGVWVLQNILAAPPPPPPPDVPDLELAKIDQSAPMRQRLEAHRENESCASCHARIDPLGFGLENFDAIGAWRTMEGSQPIDNTGVLPDGRSFAGVAELKATLLERKNDFTRCLAEKMLIYGLGRGLEPYDAPVVEEITGKVAESEYRFSSLVYEIANSLPFQKRRGEVEKHDDDTATEEVGS